jgi:hypothetical protein
MYRMIGCITALFLLLVNGPTLAQGSVGGTIGKQDKSISGDGPVDSRTQHGPHAAKNPAMASPSGPCARILGTWRWYNGVIVTVNANGTTTQSDGNSATVVCGEGTYTFTWLRIATTQMTLSSDGRRLSGTSVIGATSAVRQ